MRRLPRLALHVCFCASLLPAQENSQKPTVKSDVDLVSVYFTARDSHKRLLDDLEQSQFTVREDGKPQPIKFFSHHSDVPLNVGILLDTGTSTPSTLALEADATSMFVQKVVRPSDLAFLVSYANRVETLQVPTSDVALLKEQAQTVRSTAPVEVSLPASRMPMPDPRHPMPGVPIPQRNRDRQARLYDAVRSSVFHFLKQETGRKALLIVALSDDQHSESNLEDALIALQQSDVIAYVVQVSDGPHDDCDVFHIFAEGHLRKLAEETGGRVIEARGMNKIPEAFEQISDELHHQYSLGYYPENARWDGRFRKIEIIPRTGDVRVTARKGYYAIPPQDR
jgi:VWFA-related protein